MSSISTETVAARYSDIDQWSTAEAAAALYEAQLYAVAVVGSTVNTIAQVADCAAQKLKLGGRIIYVGAGTSGRISAQDAAELTPTFGWNESRAIIVIAGGGDALSRSIEGAEDDRVQARAQMAEIQVSASDVVICSSASGVTEFVLEALDAANLCGALTVGVTNCAGSPLAIKAEHSIVADTGAEVIAGSTRMKAGTALKVILNTLSTLVMLRLGRVCGGLMVDVEPNNKKLQRRQVEILSTLANVSAGRAQELLHKSDGQIKVAALINAGASKAQAIHLLEQEGGDLRRAMSLHNLNE